MDYLYHEGDEQILIEKQAKNLSDEIVDQLVAYRKKLKMTQQDIADATGIKRANIARIEGKKYAASLESLMKYAQCMNLKLTLNLEEM